MSVGEPFSISPGVDRDAPRARREHTRMKAWKAIAAHPALLFRAAGAAARTGPPPASTPPRTGSIRGHVLLPNGRPVTEPMRVTLRQLRGDRSVQYTDARGAFHMGGLPPGV